MVAMPYLQNMLVNGKVVQGPYLSGNPTLRGRYLADLRLLFVRQPAVRWPADLAAQALRHAASSIRSRTPGPTPRSDSIGYYGEGGQAGSQSAYMQNLYDRLDEWGPAYFDTKHNFTGSFVYDLPFGQKKKFGNHWNRAVDGVLGGWQMGGVLTAHTGFPLTIKMSGDPSGTGARSFRANVIGTPNDPHQIGPGVLFLDPSAYSAPTAGTFGNAGVGPVRGPGMKRLDLLASQAVPHH